MTLAIQKQMVLAIIIVLIFKLPLRLSTKELKDVLLLPTFARSKTYPNLTMRNFHSLFVDWIQLMLEDG